ncbi:hypothetical protein [Gordonia phthalatica]|uniref:Uncharacterized protein n=1 Tax=Gordonia phthalatica TaxID=1136941 RepID=A0A0N9NHK3_9ACTN|nr:hypothetical protein [Gordonia phthalatica]ALG85273.1 hypothetical protein ACH46_13290 [Gordonia phthalatica]
MTTTVEPAPSTPRIAVEPEVSRPLYPCECGNPDCEWREADIDNLIDGEGPWVTDRELRQVAQKVLALQEVCSFFHDHVSRSIEKFTPLSRRYTRPVALHAIREASNTWHGCPAEICGAAESA